MRLGQLPINQQVAHFRAGLRRNRTLTEVLARAAVMNLPGWYLVAGCLYQTVWNLVTRQAPEAGILDYDLAYFDSSDLSWEAEHAVIQTGRQVFAGLPAPVQIRNQARVHLWYEQKFGVPCRPTSLCGPTPCSLRATSTRSRPRGGASNGQALPSCPGLA
jgi:hypothetical protein